MRLKTPVTAEKLRNHITYGLWKYVLLAVAAVLGWNLLFTVTAYHSPQNKRIDVYVQTATTSTEVIDAFLEPIWKATVPEMETVSSVILVPTNDYASQMQMFTYIATSEGDIYFLNEETFKSYSAQRAFMPLEELVESGQIDVAGVDLKKGYVAVVDEEEEEGKEATASLHLYGIPLESYYGYMNEIMLDNRDMYAVILLNNQNDENVIPFFNALLQAGKGDMPEWLSEGAQ